MYSNKSFDKKKEKQTEEIKYSSWTTIAAGVLVSKNFAVLFWKHWNLESLSLSVLPVLFKTLLPIKNITWRCVLNSTAAEY